MAVLGMSACLYVGGAGLLDRGLAVESAVLQRGVRGAAQHGMWRAGGRLLDEMDKRGEDFQVRRGRDRQTERRREGG